MILAEAPRIYPVFTHHAKELQAAARYLIRRMEEYPRDHAPDAFFQRMLTRHAEVTRTLQTMDAAKEPYVYLTQEERDLVGRVNSWLRTSPQERRKE